MRKTSCLSEMEVFSNLRFKKSVHCKKINVMNQLNSAYHSINKSYFVEKSNKCSNVPLMNENLRKKSFQGFVVLMVLTNDVKLLIYSGQNELKYCVRYFDLFLPDNLRKWVGVLS